MTSSDTNCTVIVYKHRHNMSSPDAKLDLILVQLKALGPIQATLEDLKASICDVKEDVRSLQYEVATHGDRLAALERDMLIQQDIANGQQQHLRSLTLRLLNLPVVPGETEDNNAGLRTRVYDTVLKPLLTAAKAAKDLSSVPQVTTVIEACFRPFNSTDQDKGHPPVIIKISSKPIKIALLKNRKSLPKPAEKSTEKNTRLILVEDLTPATHKMFAAISKDKDTDKTWTINGTIKYTRLGHPTVYTVKSVFSPLNMVLGK